MTSASALTIRIAATRGLRRNPYVHITMFASFVVAVMWGMYESATALGYKWDWYRVPEYLYVIEDGEIWKGELIDGLLVTLDITLWSFLLMIVIALATAILGRSNSIVGTWMARTYIETIRNTPLLIQLYLFYFVLGPILGLDRYTTGIVALAVFEGAYAAEIVRAGLEAVPRGQWEAARSVGLSPLNVYRYVVVPQAVRPILPPLTGQTVSLVKDSAIVTVIAIFDLTTVGRDIIATTFLTFEIWFTVAAMYLSLTVTLSVFVTYLEHRMQVGRPQ